MAEKFDLLTDVLEHIIQGVAMFDGARNLALWNQRYQDVLQLPPGHLKVGRPISELALYLARRGDYGEGDPEALAKARVEALWSGEEIQREITVPNESSISGENIYAVLTQVTENGALVVTYTDVTERNHAQRELRESQERFRDFAESSADWLWEMDADLRFTYMSGNVERVLGVAPEWHYGKTRQDLLGDDYDHELWDDHLRALRERRPFRDFTFYRVGDGVKPVWLSSSGIPIFDADGAFQGYRGTGSDISERKAVEAQLIQSDKLATLGTLAAGTAHEMNQPLNIIRLIVDSIRYENDTNTPSVEVDTGDLDEVVNQVLRMAEIIEQMKSLSRRDDQGAEPFMPTDALTNALSLVERQFSSTSLNFRNTIPASCGPVRGSSGQLQQVILNLVANAKYAVDARATKTPADEPFNGLISVSLIDERAANQVRVTVSDNGGGIDETVLKNIFDPFFTTKEVGEGTGLGLSVSRSIIETMGGQLDVSIEDEGTRFTITLPCIVDAAAPASSAQSTS